MRAVPEHFDVGDATRRTWLAAERTWLAWVRTGLGFSALALTVGKIVPSLSDEATPWPYEAIGAGYALLGVVVLVYAFARRGAVEKALPRGEYVAASDAVLVGALIGAAVLGLATAVVIVSG
jgi:putative membrane protein